MARVLIADDEANLRKVLKALLAQDGHETVAVADGSDALTAVLAGGVDVLITDLKMPRMSGLELLAAVRKLAPGLPVIVITAHGTVDTAVSALKNGAFDYITKPFDKAELKRAVRKAETASRMDRAVLRDSGDAAGRYQIIGQSPAMREVYEIIEKVADTPSTVLITGESGTGKELVATALHEQSSRRDKPFIRVNCAAIPHDLLESEFFGYEQGAFTGAVAAKPGRFELADGGTLFLDEIAEIPASMQVKLLRALQESEFERVGGVRTLHVDVRLVAATNRDLRAEIDAGNFREDLYYRLNVVPVHLPTLRERREDIPLLVEAFVRKFNARLGKQKAGLSQQALACLGNYAWPGNIRELENVIERAILFSEQDTVQPQDLPVTVHASDASASAQAAGSPASTTASTTAAAETANTVASEHTDAAVKAAQQQDTATDGSTMKDIVRAATVEIERDLIRKALQDNQGNVTRAAHQLGISRKGLQNKMKEFGLRDDEEA